MDDALKQALEIVKAQASIRIMSDEEIQQMLMTLTASLKNLSGEGSVEVAQPATDVDPKSAIREKSVICLECGKSFKVLTKRHLATHGLTTEEYREKWGYKKGQSLVAKGLARDRRKKMQDMKLWEKRRATR